MFLEGAKEDTFFPPHLPEPGVPKCDIIILQTFLFFKLHREIYTAAVRTCAKKSLALMKMKIDNFEVLHSPILISLI